MKRLIADLESADDGAAVVRRYEGALAVRLEVGCGFYWLLASPCSHASKFAKELERLDEMAQTSRTAILTLYGKSHHFGMSTRRHFGMGARRTLTVARKTDT